MICACVMSIITPVQLSITNSVIAVIMPNVPRVSRNQRKLFFICITYYISNRRKSKYAYATFAWVESNAGR